MLKRFLTVALAVMVLLTVSACGNNDSGNQSSSQVSGDASLSQSSETQAGTTEDTSDMSAQFIDGVYTDPNGAFKMSIPDDWEISSKSDIIIFTSPDSDSINIVESAKDSAFDSYTEDMFKDSFSTIFSDATINSFDETTVDDLPAYKMEYTYKLSSIEIKQIQYVIDAPNATYTFSINDDDGDKTELFDEIISSIEFTK